MNLSHCHSCCEEIYWMKTDSGKNMPVDAESVVDKEAEIFAPEQMVSHFSTCKDTDKWRKK